MMELCFEKLSIPALYFMDEAVLSAFCMAKRSCLVVDLSASAATITPVVDGYSLKKSTIIDENLGGVKLDSLFSQFMAQNNFPVTPKFLFRRPNANHGFHISLIDYHRYDILRDMKQSLTFIPHYRVSDEFRSCEGLQNLGVVLPSPYSLPDGTLVNPYYELCTMAEQLYFPDKRSVNVQSVETTATSAGKKRSRSMGSKEPTSNSPATHPLLSSQSPGSLADMVYKSVVFADVDVRRELLANIVLTGGQSLLSGMSQRLQRELDDAIISQLKAKVHVRLPIERKFSSWIGGSILSICGSFQQCWVSKSQYEELGADRCVAKMAIH